LQPPGAGFCPSTWSRRSPARPAPEALRIRIRIRAPVDESEPLRVCLERSVEIEGARLRLRDWPGFSGPLVHLPDPLSPGEVVVEGLAAQFAPAFRVVSVEPRAGQPYQVQTSEVLATLDQFGFLRPVLIGEGLGCVAALVLAAWHPSAVSGLVLIDAIYVAPAEHADRVEARAIKDCPPDWTALRSAVQSPILEVSSTDPAAEQRLQAFVRIP
jgi:pimeloyl-ACP methyl ester carboxylesterase